MVWYVVEISERADQEERGAKWWSAKQRKLTTGKPHYWSSDDRRSTICTKQHTISSSFSLSAPRYLSHLSDIIFFFLADVSDLSLFLHTLSPIQSIDLFLIRKPSSCFLSTSLSPSLYLCLLPEAWQTLSLLFYTRHSAWLGFVLISLSPI